MGGRKILKMISISSIVVYSLLLFLKSSFLIALIYLNKATIHLHKRKNKSISIDFFQN